MHNWPSWIEHFWGLLVWYLWYLERLFTSIKCKWKALVGLFDILSDFQLKSTLCQISRQWCLPSSLQLVFQPVADFCKTGFNLLLDPGNAAANVPTCCSILQKDKKILFLCNRPSWFYRMTRKILFGKPVLHILNSPAVEFSAQDLLVSSSELIIIFTGFLFQSVEDLAQDNFRCQYLAVIVAAQSTKSQYLKYFFYLLSRFHDSSVE